MIYGNGLQLETSVRTQVQLITDTGGYVQKYLQKYVYVGWYTYTYFLSLSAEKTYKQ